MKINITIIASFIVFICYTMPVLGQNDIINNSDSLKSDDLYFGQKPPGKKAEMFAPDALTIEPHESPIILRDELTLILGAMEEGIVFYGMMDGNLSIIENPLGFDIPDICNGIAVSPSGNRIYIRDWNNGNGYFYSIDKKENGWTPPKSLGKEVNSIDTHWQFTVAMNENLYFLSREQGIVVSVYDGDSHLKPVPLMLEDDNILKGGTPYISPDESYIIFGMSNDLHISYNLGDGKWTMPRNLGPNVNSDQLDLCPRISPNGKYLFFISRRNGPDFVTYWADASFIKELRPQGSK